MRRLPMTCVGQRICGVDEGAAWNCGCAATWARARLGVMLAKRSNGRRTRELSKLTGDPVRITPVSELTGAERRRPKRLERMRTGWDVHFRELALTRIPVK